MAKTHVYSKTHVFTTTSGENFVIVAKINFGESSVNVMLLLFSTLVKNVKHKR